MGVQLKEYISKSGETILYIGHPNLSYLDELADGFGDVWHSSLDQGFKNIFPEIVYQTTTLFWYVRDLEHLDLCVNWRINPYQFAVRKSVWDTLQGFDEDFQNPIMQALDFGYNVLRNNGGVVLYAKGLFDAVQEQNLSITTKDRYAFFIKNFKIDHSFFMVYRKGLWNLKEWNALFFAKRKYKQKKSDTLVTARPLKELAGSPTVSYIIPTMMRQDYTLQLLADLQNQTYQPTQVVVVDATPEGQRDESLYNPANYNFELIVQWQTTKGSCRARNEAIDLCTGEFIVFGDDDIRIPTNFIENHLRYLQTYKADACNGLDIRADHQQQTLDDLYKFKFITSLPSVGFGYTSNNFTEFELFLTPVAEAENALAKAKVSNKIMIDTSHANSNKDPYLQPLVLKNITEQILDGNKSIVGLMVESHLKGGRQDIPENLDDLEYGQSVTDGCIDWETTEKALLDMHEALKDVLPNR